MARNRGLGVIPGLGGASRPTAPPAPGPPPATVGRPDVRFRRPTLFPRGPEILALGQKRVHTGGPGEAPPGFVSATSSLVEWYWYWGSYRVLAPHLDPRQGPWDGIVGVFAYQVAEDAGDVRSVGSYVSDFVYFLGTGELVVRIDTFYYHVATTPDQIARDLYQKLHGGNEDLLIISAYDDDILGDPSGRAVCQAVANALAGREPVSPVRGGIATPVRDAIGEHTAAARP